MTDEEDGFDIYAEYMKRFGVTREVAKTRLFGLIYGHKLTPEDFKAIKEKWGRHGSDKGRDPSLV